MSYCPFCDTNEEYRFLKTLDRMRIIYPKNPIIKNHFLIAPIEHLGTVDQLDPGSLAEFGQLLNLILGVVPESIGYNILSNNGSKAVNQQVAHAHIHIFVRVDGDIDPLSAPHDKGIREFTGDELSYIHELKSTFSIEKGYN